MLILNSMRASDFEISHRYDVDFPVDCDDEYWDQSDPDSNFKQPAGTPSKVSYFIHYLKLMDILAYSMRAIVSNHFPDEKNLILKNIQYPIRQTKLVSGRPVMKPTQQLIAELDSLLNQWLDAMPEHRLCPSFRCHSSLLSLSLVKWDPDRRGPFFKQSAMLYSNYYNLQVSILCSCRRT